MTITATRKLLGRLRRFFWVERVGSDYRLHALLRNYTSSKLMDSPSLFQNTHYRHAAWFIRRVLHHPAVLEEVTDPIPDLGTKWAEVITGVGWATDNDPQLAAWAVLLAHTERSVLVAELGNILIEAVLKYQATLTNKAEQAVWHEILGDLYLLQQDFQAGLNHFEQAADLWQSIPNWLACSQAKLRVAGVKLLQQDWAAAVEAARQAQSFLENELPLDPSKYREAYWLFYWFDVIYFTLVRWPNLPETDVANLEMIGKQTGQSVLEARVTHIYCSWCLAKERDDSVETKQKGRQLALQAYRLWRANQRLDRATEAISWSNYLINNRYSRRAAARYAKRRSKTTPQLSETQRRLVKNEAQRWWLGATEAQRVAWMSHMFPRYLAATNEPKAPLKAGTRAWHWVRDIIDVGVIGSGGRRLTTGSNPPDDHFLEKSAWRVLSGQLAFPLVNPAAIQLVQDCLVRLDYQFGGKSKDFR